LLRPAGTLFGLLCQTLPPITYRMSYTQFV